MNISSIVFERPLVSIKLVWPATHVEHASRANPQTKINRSRLEIDNDNNVLLIDFVKRSWCSFKRTLKSLALVLAGLVRGTVYALCVVFEITCKGVSS